VELDPGKACHLDIFATKNIRKGRSKKFRTCFLVPSLSLLGVPDPAQFFYKPRPVIHRSARPYLIHIVYC
jgi:hypothetical protein